MLALCKVVWVVLFLGCVVILYTTLTPKVPYDESKPFPPSVTMRGLDMRQPQARTLPLEKKTEICNVYTSHAVLILEWRELGTSLQSTLQHLREMSPPGMVDAMVNLAQTLYLLPVAHSVADYNAARELAAVMCWHALEQG